MAADPRTPRGYLQDTGGGDKPLDEHPRTVELSISIEPLPMPPAFDALLVGRAAPVGPEGVRRWLAAVAPDRYDVYTFQGDLQVVALRRSLLGRMPGEALLKHLQAEWAWAGDPEAVLAVRIAWAASSRAILPATGPRASGADPAPGEAPPPARGASPTDDAGPHHAPLRRRSRPDDDL